MFRFIFMLAAMLGTAILLGLMNVHSRPLYWIVPLAVGYIVFSGGGKGKK